GAYGAALAAGVGSGTWSDFDEALTSVSVEKTFVPQQASVETYEKVFAVHRGLYDQLRPVYQEAAALCRTTTNRRPRWCSTSTARSPTAPRRPPARGPP